MVTKGEKKKKVGIGYKEQGEYRSTTTPISPAEGEREKVC